MAYSSPMFQQLNGLTSNETKLARAFPLKAATEAPTGFNLYSRFAFAGAVCVSNL